VPEADAREAVEFAGESFAMAKRIGLMPLMRFAKIAQGGVDSQELAGLAAMYDLLEQCIAPEDWARFQAAADRSRADDEELMAVVGEVIERLSDRPTRRPSDSSAGSPTTALKSTASPSSPVLQRLAGRQDLQAFVVAAQEAQAS
jgi:hypothetical protein